MASMNPEEVRRLREFWQAKGSPPCEHAVVDTEHDPETSTDRKVCLTCGAYVMEPQGARYGGPARIDDAFERKGYRRHIKGETWHFCSNCSQWPKTDYNFSATRPASENFCAECISRVASGTCA